jgi:alkaline phosphatase D
LAHELDRRSALRAGAAVAGLALLSPLSVQARASEGARRGAFGFGVASGDPTGTAVILWTRVTPTPDAVPGSGRGKPVDVRWELAEDEAFRRVVRTGRVRTDAGRDHTVKADATGLSPYTRYWYRFSALGQTSPVGRTQTAPDDGGRHALRLGVASCANFTGGYFSAYRHLAARDDLDAVVFLGDYLYEYCNGEDRYGPEELRGKREHVPSGEPVTLAQYRMRHGCYKADPDLQAAHGRHPWIMIFDDHEVCDNTYADGGVNHQPDEGSFAKRRAAAYQAYLEWVPLRLPDQRVPHQGTRFWRSFSYGSLADLHVLETRQNRSEQVAGTDGGAVDDPRRHLVEPAQLSWLQQDLARPGTRWRLLANQVVLAPVRLPPLPAADPLTGALEQVGVARNGAVFNADQWDGYGADQKALVDTMATRAKGDVVVLTGDIHSSWANDIPADPGRYVPVDGANNSVAVEFVTPSVTSDGFAEILGGAQAARAATTAVQASNRHVRYLEGVHHGFLVLDVTPERVQTDFVYISDRLDPAATAAVGASWVTEHGSKQVRPAAAALGRRSDQPAQRVLLG